MQTLGLYMYELRQNNIAVFPSKHLKDFQDIHWQAILFFRYLFITFYLAKMSRILKKVVPFQKVSQGLQPNFGMATISRWPSVTEFCFAMLSMSLYKRRLCDNLYMVVDKLFIARICTFSMAIYDFYVHWQNNVGIGMNFL